MSFDDDARDRECTGTHGADLAGRLVQIAAELGTDELRVLVAIAERLRAGRRRYGGLHLATDRRNWCAEAMAEMLDCAVYLSCGLLRGAR